MIPLRDVIPSRTTPYITFTIIGLNALAWFYELGLAPRELAIFLQQFGVVPAAGHMCSGTCGTCGSSATTWRIGSATAAS
jgi:hypothetical protein